MYNLKTLEIRNLFNQENKKKAFTLDKIFSYSDGEMSEREKIEMLAMKQDSKLEFYNNRFWIDYNEITTGISKLAAVYFDHVKQSLNLDSNYIEVTQKAELGTIKERINKNKKAYDKLISKWQDGFTVDREKLNKLKLQIEQDEILLSSPVA
jgi:lipase chaperone LimK